MQIFIKILLIISQILIVITVRTLYFGKVKVKTDISYFPDRPFVIASNHQNSMDPFIISCFVPLKFLIKTIPARFITANIFYYRWFRPLAFLAGCYPSHANYADQNEDKYGIGASINHIKNDYNVLIFPEGRRTKEKLPAKYGVSKILERTDANLLLCKIEWTKGKITINFKNPSNSVEKNNPQTIIDEIYRID